MIRDKWRAVSGNSGAVVSMLICALAVFDVAEHVLHLGRETVRALRAASAQA
jgi:hypothetical protein